MTSPEDRAKAIQELKKLIRVQRARLNPAVLEIAEKALQRASPQSIDALFGKGTAQQIQNRPPAAKAAAKTSGPGPSIAVDRDKMAQAIELFLKGHKDTKKMQLKLLEMMRKKDS